MHPGFVFNFGFDPNRGGNGQGERKVAALAQFTLYPDAPAMMLNNLFGDG
jgi:hypothetical protein